MVGAVAPDAINDEVKEGQERSHPAFYSLPEQWEGWTQQVTGLKKRFAFVRQPNGQTVKIESLPLPDPIVDPVRLAAIEARYLESGFRPASLTLPTNEVIFAPSSPSRPRWDEG